jgi:hypothetical protein
LPLPNPFVVATINNPVSPGDLTPPKMRYLIWSRPRTFNAMKPLYFICSALCFFGASIVAQAQSDSVRTEYKTEDEGISRSEIQRLFRYITRANVEETTLIKIGGLPSSVNLSQSVNSIGGGINTDISIERKIYPSVSVLFGFDSQLSASRFFSGKHAITTQDFRNFAVSSSAKVAVRYYYSMARRIKEGKAASNLSGTYLSLQADRPVLGYTRIRQFNGASGGFRTELFKQPLWSLDMPSYVLLWGFQQRLGKRGYVDLNAGPALTIYGNRTSFYMNTYSQKAFSLRLNAVIGLAW